jgi:hypothetical protein
VPEVVEPGVTGFIVDTIDEAVSAIPMAKALDRGTIRVASRSGGAVARDYLALYDEVLRRRDAAGLAPRAATADAETRD